MKTHIKTLIWKSQDIRTSRGIPGNSGKNKTVENRGDRELGDFHDVRIKNKKNKKQKTSGLNQVTSGLHAEKGPDEKVSLKVQNKGLLKLLLNQNWSSGCEDPDRSVKNIKKYPKSDKTYQTHVEEG